MAARARHRAVAGLVLAALALAGCGRPSDAGISGGGKVIGRTADGLLADARPGGRGRDFVDGEKLALADAAGASARSRSTSPRSTSAAPTSRRRPSPRGGRSRTRRSSPPSSTRRPVTVPLFNAAGILQVAPGGDAALAQRPAGPPVRAPHGRAAGRRAAVPRRLRAALPRRLRPRPGALRTEGYRAMSGVLQAIARAGPRGNDRTRVIAAYFSRGLRAQASPA